MRIPAYMSSIDKDIYIWSKGVFLYGLAVNN